MANTNHVSYNDLPYELGISPSRVYSLFLQDKLPKPAGVANGEHVYHRVDVESLRTVVSGGERIQDAAARVEELTAKQAKLQREVTLAHDSTATGRIHRTARELRAAQRELDTLDSVEELPTTQEEITEQLELAKEIESGLKEQAATSRNPADNARYLAARRARVDLQKQLQPKYTSEEVDELRSSLEQKRDYAAEREASLRKRYDAGEASGSVGRSISRFAKDKARAEKELSELPQPHVEPDTSHVDAQARQQASSDRFAEIQARIDKLRAEADRAATYAG